MEHASLFTYFSHAGLVVKTVMLLLLILSIFSWTIIIQRLLLFRKMHEHFSRFEALFSSANELTPLYQKTLESKPLGVASIFRAGFAEFVEINKVVGRNKQDVINGVERAMRVAGSKEQEHIETHLSALAVIASASPFIGLFGTVWGIMTSFQALGSVQHATIAMVAPGISEALIATAMGLFSAIPAVIAYNRLSSVSAKFEQRMFNFQDEFTNLVARQDMSASPTE